MELRQLKHFLAILEQGSLGRAAKVLNISEPGLSKSIRNLETRLQVQLLDRNTRGMTPTLYGESLAIHARLIRNELEHAYSELNEIRGFSKGVVRIGARPSFGTVVLPKAIARLHSKHPRIQIVMREGMMSNIIVELLSGDLDFIVVTIENQPPDENLIQKPLLKSPVSIVARSNHHLGGKGPISPKELCDVPWILPLGSDPVRKKLGELLADCGVGAINIVAESDSVQFIMEYLLETDAVGFFPEAMVLRRGIENDFTILDVEQLTWQREIGIIQRKNKSLTPAARLLMQELEILCTAKVAL